MGMSAKEVAHAFRYTRAFLKFKKSVKQATPLAQYTNLSLAPVWEKFDCQTQLLCREALVPIMQRSPEALDADWDNFGVKRFSLHFVEEQISSRASPRPGGGAFAR